MPGMPQPVFHSSTVYGIVYDVVFLARKSLYKYHVIVIIICSMTTNVNSKGGGSPTIKNTSFFVPWLPLI
jgi:hypothetical protein